MLGDPQDIAAKSEQDPDVFAAIRLNMMSAILAARV